MGLIAIGDIHGCAETLDAMLDRLSPTADDHLVFVGDYIDRGPDSKGVIDRLIRLKEIQPCTFLRGNHERFMLDYLDSGEYEMWRVNGGLATLSGYLNQNREIEIPPEHEAFIRETRLYLDTPDFLFVHAGLKPKISVAENLMRFDEGVFVWERSHLENKKPVWEKVVVCGHTPRPEPINREKLIAIDTGCVYYTYPEMGRLTAVRLPEREFVSVKYRG